MSSRSLVLETRLLHHSVFINTQTEQFFIFYFKKLSLWTDRTFSINGQVHKLILYALELKEKKNRSNLPSRSSPQMEWRTWKMKTKSYQTLPAVFFRFPRRVSFTGDGYNNDMKREREKKWEINLSYWLWSKNKSHLELMQDVSDEHTYLLTLRNQKPLR